MIAFVGASRFRHPVGVNRLALALSLGLFACAETALPPSDGDLVPEVAISGSAMAREYVPHDGFHVSPVLDAPQGATRVGVLLQVLGEGSVSVQARGFDVDGTPGAWRALAVTWEEDDQRVGNIDFGFDAYAAQIRVSDPRRVGMITWSAVVPVPEPERGAIGGSMAPLRAELAALGVRDRAAWGARASRCTDGDPSKNRMAIHHTVTPSSGDPASRLRGIQNYHMDTRGWCDTGYHFLVSIDGTVWEGRPLDFLGAHVGGHNTGNVGISFIGCFHSSDCSDWTPFMPPDAMIDGASAVVGRLSSLYDIALDAEHVKGHRDHPDQGTSCPGDFLHARLGDIRARAGGATSDPRFGARYVEQSFPFASMPFVLAPGEVRAGFIEMRNTGTETWEPGVTFLGTTEPRDGPSPLAAPSWPSDHRAASIDRVVPPGETGRFEFSVRAPLAMGEYPQFFGIVQEGISWFSEPGEGGPADDQLQVRVTVTMDGVLEDGGTDAGSDAGDVDAGARDGGLDSDAAVDPRDGVSGGCGCRTSGGPTSFGGWALALLLWTRRRL